MTFASSFGRTFSPTFQPNSQAAASGGWWDLDGAIDSCVAAYQAKGAASLAASYVNLANPGTYNLTEGVAPTFDATGWLGTSTSYLKTGITPSENWSMIVRFSDAPSGICAPCGSRISTTNSAFYFLPNYHGDIHFGNQGYHLLYDAAITEGVLAIAGQDGYKNGTDVCDIPAATNTGWREIYIMARDDGSANAFFNGGHVSAVAIYNTVLTSTQVGLLTTAMAAL